MYYVFKVFFSKSGILVVVKIVDPIRAQTVQRFVYRVRVPPAIRQAPLPLHWRNLNERRKVLMRTIRANPRSSLIFEWGSV
jgi:hypothetical protein